MTRSITKYHNSDYENQILAITQMRKEQEEDHNLRHRQMEQAALDQNLQLVIIE